MTETVMLCPADDVLENEIMKVALPDGHAIALYRVGDTIYATDDLCTHGDASLSEEGIQTGTSVECTFHFGTFDITTGAPTGMPCEVPLKTYPVRLVDGQVAIEV